MSDKIKVLVVEPEQSCRVQEIPDTLEAMQAIVGGHIESFSFLKEAIIFNENGKLLDLPRNRPLFDQDGTAFDIIRGTFFVAGINGEHFASLTEDQVQWYKEKYDNMQALTAETPAIQAEILSDSNLRDFAVSCEVIIHFDGDDAATKEALIQRVTEIYNSGKELSDRTVGGLEFEFEDSQVKVQYTFARRDSDEAKAKTFSAQCVRAVQDKLEKFGYQIGEVCCFAEELEPDPTPRHTQNKKKGTHHER